MLDPEAPIYGIPEAIMDNPFSFQGVTRKMKNKTFDELMDGLKELHAKKNSDYASDDNPYSNFEYAASLLVGFTNPVDQVFVAIIGIKLARLAQLLGTDKIPNNESIQDSMRDLTNYCAIWTSRYIDNLPFNLVKKNMEKAMVELSAKELGETPEPAKVGDKLMETYIKRAWLVIENRNSDKDHEDFRSLFRDIQNDLKRGK